MASHSCEQARLCMPHGWAFFLCVKSRVISTHHIVLHTHRSATLGFRQLHRVVSSGTWSGMLRSCVLMQTTTTLSVCTRASLLMLTVAMALEKVAGSYGRTTRNDLWCCLFVTLLGRSLHSIRSILTTDHFSFQPPPSIVVATSFLCLSPS